MTATNAAIQSGINEITRQFSSISFLSAVDGRCKAILDKKMLTEDHFWRGDFEKIPVLAAQITFNVTLAAKAKLFRVSVSGNFATDSKDGDGNGIWREALDMECSNKEMEIDIKYVGKPQELLGGMIKSCLVAVFRTPASEKAVYQRFFSLAKDFSGKRCLNKDLTCFATELKSDGFLRLQFGTATFYPRTTTRPALPGELLGSCSDGMFLSHSAKEVAQTFLNGETFSIVLEKIHEKTMGRKCQEPLK